MLTCMSHVIKLQKRKTIKYKENLEFKKLKTKGTQKPKKSKTSKERLVTLKSQN